MKAVFIIYNQSLTGPIRDILEKLDLRGFTQWQGISGTGSVKWVPHEGTHTWPELNNAHLVVAEDHQVPPLLSELVTLNQSVEEQGLRTFVWNIEATV